MAGYIRMQEFTEISGGAVQPLEEAVDLGDFGTIVVRLHVAVAGGGTLYLQHAAVLDDRAFENVVFAEPLRLSQPGTQIHVIRAPLRYLRWVAKASGTVGFEVDLIGREGSSGGVPVDALEDALALGGTAVKTSDETITSDNTLSDDAELSVPVQANASYALEAFLLVDAHGTPDFQWTFTVPSGATLTWTNIQNGNQAGVGSAGSPFISPGIGAVAGTSCIGALYTGATAGSVTMQWAQNTSSTEATTLKRGTWMRLRRLD